MKGDVLHAQEVLAARGRSGDGGVVRDVQVYNHRKRLIRLRAKVDTLTLSRPGDLLVGVHARHRRVNLEPDAARTVPCCGSLACGDFGEVVLSRARVVYLLGRDIVDRGAGRNLNGFGRILRRVAADVCAGRAQHAGFAIGVLGLARSGPISIFRLAVDDESWERVCDG